MAIAHVRNSGFIGGVGIPAGSVSYTFPSLPTVGNLIVVAMTGYRGGGTFGTFSVTDNKGSTFTVNQYDFKANGIDNLNAGFASLRVPAGWTGTYTVTVASTDTYSSLGASVLEYSGAVAIGPVLDRIDKGFAVSATTLTLTNALTTSQAIETVVALMGIENYSNAAGITTPSGFTSRTVNQDSAQGLPFGVADKNITATGVQSAAWGYNSTVFGIGIIATLIAYVAPGGVPTNQLTGGGELPFGDVYVPEISWGVAPPALSGGGLTFNISAVARDDVGIQFVVLTRNGVEVARSTTPALSYQYTVGGGETAVIQWAATVTDSTGRVASVYANTALSSDTVTPTITLSGAPLYVTQTTDQVTLTALASDNVGVDRVEFYAGAVGSGALVASVAVAPYRTIRSFTRDQNGQNLFYARVFDLAGNSTNSTVVVVAVNIVDALAISIVSIPDLTGAVGAILSWRVRVTRNGLPVVGIGVSAQSSNLNVFSLPAANAVLGILLSVAEGGNNRLLSVLDAGLNVFKLSIGIPSGLTNDNGEVTFSGTIAALALIGQTSTLMFDVDGVAVRGLVTVGFAIAPDWITVYRDATSWFRIPRS